MSDPREVIYRTVLPPPPQSTPAMPNVASAELIGKIHGRLRCVNLSLTQAARDELYIRARRDSITLGEAMMDALDEAGEDCPTARRPGRTAAVRRGVDVRPVYVLLTPAEAAHLAAQAHQSRRSISDFASRVLVSCPNAKEQSSHHDAAS